MAEIEIHEHIVEPACNWTTLMFNEIKDAQSTDVCAHKIVFDRAYPFFWIILRTGSTIGVALTKADVERAVFEDETTQLKSFNLRTDGVVPVNIGQAFCVASGSRKTLYVLPQYSNKEYEILIAAQDDTVCPLTQIYGWA